METLKAAQLAMAEIVEAPHRGRGIASISEMSRLSGVTRQDTYRILQHATREPTTNRHNRTSVLIEQRFDGPLLASRLWEPAGTMSTDDQLLYSALHGAAVRYATEERDLAA